MPREMRLSDENFSVTFSGPAFDRHEISAASLAESLLALDSLSKICGHAAYGKEADIEVKVKGTPRAGSFIIDLAIAHPVESAAVSASAVTVLTGVIALAKWAYGKSVRILGESGSEATVENESNDIGAFEKEALRIYGLSKTKIDLSRLTQTLDREGADSVSIGSESGHEEVITRADRRFFRDEDGEVITDNESQMVLEVTGPRLNGLSDGWTFSEGEDGAEFKAQVEDDDFLQKVRAGDYSFKSGTTILAIVRIVQIRKNRTRTKRSIIQVLDVHNQ